MGDISYPLPLREGKIIKHYRKINTGRLRSLTGCRASRGEWVCCGRKAALRWLYWFFFVAGRCPTPHQRRCLWTLPKGLYPLETHLKIIPHRAIQLYGVKCAAGRSPAYWRFFVSTISLTFISPVAVLRSFSESFMVIYFIVSS